MAGGGGDEIGQEAACGGKKARGSRWVAGGSGLGRVQCTGSPAPPPPKHHFLSPTCGALGHIQALPPARGGVAVHGRGQLHHHGATPRQCVPPVQQPGLCGVRARGAQQRWKASRYSKGFRAEFVCHTRAPPTTPWRPPAVRTHIWRVGSCAAGGRKHAPAQEVGDQLPHVRVPPGRQQLHLQLKLRCGVGPVGEVQYDSMCVRNKERARKFCSVGAWESAHGGSGEVGRGGASQHDDSIGAMRSDSSISHRLEVHMRTRLNFL